VLKSGIPINEFLTDFAQRFGEFLTLEQQKELLDNQLKIVLDALLTTKKSLTDIVKALGFDAPMVDQDDLTKIVQEVLNEHPTIVQQYQG
jgi:Asp-tRNA(Asn)/Glu-tRNA(Gln) amidotransferase B subunit